MASVEDVSPQHNNTPPCVSNQINQIASLRKLKLTLAKETYKNFPEDNDVSLELNVLNARYLSLNSHWGLEGILADPKKSYEDKIGALLTAWEHIISNFLSTHQSSPASQASASSLIKWIHPSTVKLVLHSTWRDVQRVIRTHMDVTLTRCHSLLTNADDIHTLKTLVNIVKDPWNHPTLNRIFDRKYSNTNHIHDHEALTYCNSEKAITLATRLEMLCISKCEDFAWKLADICMRWMKLDGCVLGDEGVDGDQRYIHFIIDVFVALLVRNKNFELICERLDKMDIEEGSKLVLRFMDRHAKDHAHNLWQCSLEVAELATQFFLTTAMLTPLNKVDSFVTLMSNWIALHNANILNDLPGITRALIQIAASSRHIFTLVKLLEEKFGADFKSLYIEYCIRGLVMSMNELEYLKSFTKDRDMKNIREMAIRMSDGFLYLAHLSKDNISVCRESTLTAFSLNPTEACYDEVKRMAKECGMLETPHPANLIVFDEDVVTEVVITNDSAMNGCLQHSENATGTLCTICGGFTNKKEEVKHFDVQVDGAMEELGLTPQLCDALLVVLGGPRYKFLSWVLDWNELSSTCEKYLKDDSVRNTEKELNFLNIDYNQFKGWLQPQTSEEEYPGIEKGYEKCLLIEEDEEEEPIVKQSKSFKKRAAFRTDSDSSLEPKKRGRPKKYATHSDESSTKTVVLQRKTKKKNLLLSSVTDYDTTTQDSLANSTASDGLVVESPKETKSLIEALIEESSIGSTSPSDEDYSVELSGNSGKVKSSYGTRAAQKKLQQLCPSSLEVPIIQNVDAKKVPMTFTIDENGDAQPARILPSYGKRISDPKTLQQLRMFRHPSKRPIDAINNSMDGEQIGKQKYAPLLSTLNLNPRIVLHRTEDSTPPTKVSPKKPLTSNNGVTDVRKNEVSKNLFGVNTKTGQVMGLDFLASVLMVDRDVLREREILKANVPGLTSLDMIVPPPSETTVQIVQLSQNLTSTVESEDNTPNPPKPPPQSTSTPSSLDSQTTSHVLPSQPLNLTQRPDNPPEILLENTRLSSTPTLPVERPLITQNATLASLLNTPTSIQVSNICCTDVKDEKVESSGVSGLDLSLGNTEDLPLDSRTAIKPEALDCKKEDLKQKLESASPLPCSTVEPPLPVPSHIQVTESDASPSQSTSVDPVLVSDQKPSTSSAEGLPKFHQAFNKGSRSIYCQTTTASSVPPTLPAPVTQVEADVNVPDESPANTSDSDTGKSSVIQTGIISQADQLGSLNIVLPSQLPLTQMGPVIRVIRGSGMSQHPTTSMVYIAPVNTTPARTMISNPIVKTFAHFSPSDGTILKPIVLTKESLVREQTNPTFLSRPAIPCTITSATPQSRDQEVCVVESSSDEEVNLMNRPVIQKTLVKPVGAQVTRVIRQVLQISPNINPQLTNLQTIQNYPTTTIADLKTGGNQSRPSVSTAGAIDSVSSSTLKQILEFEGVLKQFTETSKMKEKGEKVTDPNSKPVASHPIPQQGTVLTTSGTDFQVEHIPCLKVPMSRILPVPSVSLTGNVVKTPKVTKVVMVTSNCQSLTSPTLTLTTQSLTTQVSSTSPGKTPPSKSSKSSKSKSVKSSPSTSTGSKSSPVPKPQQKPQEDEQTAQRIYAILDEYAEQLRNSPDLNNKPAPRRRSNPPTNPSQTSKRKKSSQSKVKLLGQSCSNTTEMSPGVDDPGTMGSEDSSSNMMQLSQAHDSPGPSQSADEALSITPSLESSTEGGNLKSVVTESSETQPSEASRHTLICGTVQGVFLKEGVQSGEVAGNATVVAGKPVIVGSSGTMPIYMHGNVREMLMQTLKGQKVIRVQQVSVPGVAGSSGIQGTTLVLRHMMQQSPAKQQGKLPVGTISSQALSGISAQPPVVVPLSIAGTSRVLSFAPEDISMLQTTRAPTSFHNQIANALGNVISSNMASVPVDRLTYQSITTEPDNLVTISSNQGVLPHRPSTVESKLTKPLPAMLSLPMSFAVAPVSSAMDEMADVCLERRRTLVVGRSLDTANQAQRNEAQLTVVQPQQRSFQSVTTNKDRRYPTSQYAEVEDPSASKPWNDQPRVSAVPVISPVKRGMDTSSPSVGGSPRIFQEMSEMIPQSEDSSITEHETAPNSGPALLTVGNAIPVIQSGQNAVKDSQVDNRLSFSQVSDIGASTIQHKTENVGLIPIKNNSCVEYPIKQPLKDRPTGIMSGSMVLNPLIVDRGDPEQTDGEPFDQNVCGKEKCSDSPDFRHMRDVQPATLMDLSSDDDWIETNRPSTSSKQSQVCQQLVFATDDKQVDSTSEVDSSGNHREGEDLKGLKESPKRAPALSLMSGHNTDSTGTSDIDSTENNPFGTRNKQSCPLRRKSEPAEGHSHLLSKYRMKPEQRPPQRPRSRSEKILELVAERRTLSSCVQSSKAEKTVVRPFTEALLQKSLSEECEDLGVDRPSTSDLFPEADLLLELDTNSSPCFDSMPTASCGLDLVKPVAMFTGGSNMQPAEFSSSSPDDSRMSSPGLSNTNSNDSKPENSRKRMPRRSAEDSNSNEGSSRISKVSPHRTRSHSRCSNLASTCDSNSNEGPEKVEAVSQGDMHSEGFNSNLGSQDDSNSNDGPLNRIAKISPHITRSYNRKKASSCDSVSSDEVEKIESIKPPLADSHDGNLATLNDGNSVEGHLVTGYEGAHSMFEPKKQEPLVRNESSGSTDDTNSNEAPTKKVAGSSDESNGNEICGKKIAKLSPHMTRSRGKKKASESDSVSSDELDKEKSSLNVDSNVLVSLANNSIVKDVLQPDVCSAKCSDSGGDVAIQKDIPHQSRSRNKPIADSNRDEVTDTKKESSVQQSVKKKQLTVNTNSIEPDKTKAIGEKVNSNQNRNRQKASTKKLVTKTISSDEKTQVVVHKDLSKPSRSKPMIDINSSDILPKVKINTSNLNQVKPKPCSKPITDNTSSDELEKAKITVSKDMTISSRNKTKAIGKPTTDSNSSDEPEKSKPAPQCPAEPILCVNPTTDSNSSDETEKKETVSKVLVSALESKSIKITGRAKSKSQPSSIGQVLTDGIKKVCVPIRRNRNRIPRGPQPPLSIEVLKVLSRPRSSNGKPVVKAEELNGRTTDPVNGGNSSSATVNDLTVNGGAASGKSVTQLDDNSVPKMALQIQRKLAMHCNSQFECSTEPSTGGSTFTASSSSSNDSITLPDPYISTFAISSKVTIPSPVPLSPIIEETESEISTQASQIPSSDGPLIMSSMTGQKYGNTYKRLQRTYTNKRLSANIKSAAKKARLMDGPNQYANEHMDSEEAWESSSSRDKDGADDEDSGSLSRTEFSSEPGDIDEATQSSSQFNGLEDIPQLLINNVETKKTSRKRGTHLTADPITRLRSSKRSKAVPESPAPSPPKCDEFETGVPSSSTCLEACSDLAIDDSDPEHQPRRSSQRGVVKKGCAWPCCNGLPGSSTVAKKKEIVKVDKVIAKKTQPTTKKVVKCNNTKKR